MAKCNIQHSKGCFAQLRLLFAGLYGNTSLELPVKGQTSIKNKQQLFWNERYGKAGSCLLSPPLKGTKTNPTFCASFPSPQLPEHTENDGP